MRSRARRILREKADCKQSTMNSKPPTIPLGIVEGTFSDNQFLEWAVYESYIWFPIAVTFFSLFIHFSFYSFFLFADNSEGVYMIPGRLSRRRESTPVPSHGSTFVYMIPPQNVMPARVTPAWVHPGCCTGARISLRVRNLATVSCKRETTTRFGVKSIYRSTGTGSACVMFAILNHTGL